MGGIVSILLFFCISTILNHLCCFCFCFDTIVGGGGGGGGGVVLITPFHDVRGEKVLMDIRLDDLNYTL